MTDKANTPDEILDLVNEHDEVIGEVTKGQAHGNPSLIHREIAIVLYDKQNRVLFQQRSQKKLVKPGAWAISCAGHVPKGMKPIDAAHMELKEELGIDTELFFIEKELYKTELETSFAYWYIGKYTGEPMTIEKEEVEQVRFLDEKGLEEIIKDKYFSGSINWARRFWSGEFDRIIGRT